MTRLLTTGWETGDINEMGGVAAGTQAVVTSSPTPRSPGAYCLRIGNAAGTANREWTLPATKTEVWTRFSFYAHGFTSQELMFILFSDSAGSSQGCVTFNPGDGFLRVYRGAATTFLA